MSHGKFAICQLLTWGSYCCFDPWCSTDWGAKQTKCTWKKSTTTDIGVCQKCGISHIIAMLMIKNQGWVMRRHDIFGILYFQTKLIVSQSHGHGVIVFQPPGLGVSGSITSPKPCPQSSCSSVSSNSFFNRTSLLTWKWTNQLIATLKPVAGF